MAGQSTTGNHNPYQQRRRGRRYQMNDRQSFVDILGTVLRYVLIVVLIMVIIRASRDAYNMGYEVFSNKAMAQQGQGESVTVTITSGMSDREVGDLLQEDGLISDARVFPLQVRLASGGHIVPGTYTLSTEMTTDEILNTLTADSEEENDEGSTEASREGTSEATTSSEGASIETTSAETTSEETASAEGASAE